MSQTITATYEDGVVKPSRPLDLSPHSRVLVTIQCVEQEAVSDRGCDLVDELERIWKESAILPVEPHLGRGW